MAGHVTSEYEATGCCRFIHYYLMSHVYAWTTGLVKILVDIIIANRQCVRAVLKRHVKVTTS